MSSEIVLKNEFGYAELLSLSDDIQVLCFKHQTCQGSISLYGGQVLTWQPTAQQPMFWLSRASEYSTKHAIRGGVPICWPWFGGEVKQGNGEIKKASNHGFIRQSQWQLDNIVIGESQVIITLSLNGHGLSSHWPAKFMLSQKLVFSAQFQQILTMTNLSEHSVEYTAALHSYFCVSSPEKVKIPSLEAVRFDDKLSGEKNKLAELANCTGPIDRIYHDSNQQTIVDSGWQREITVTHENCQQWVLWNPGQGAKLMSDMHKNSEQEFICLEAANTHWQQLASQRSASISQCITVKNL